MIDEIRLILVTTSEGRLDQKLYNQPINSLPAKCTLCGFPDINAVPQPYYIARSRASTSSSVSLAEMGNFLVKPIVKGIIEGISQSICTFYPTYYRNTEEVSNWSLAVPSALVDTGHIKDSIPRCPECGEPRSGHYGTQYEYNSSHSIAVDIAKSRNWMSGDRGWDVDLTRQHLISIRLYQLLKKLKLKGIFEVGGDTPLTSNENRWVKAKLAAFRNDEQ